MRMNWIRFVSKDVTERRPYKTTNIKVMLLFLLVS